MEKQKVALALGSGGARGIAHIGVIEELNSRGFDITSISGTSIGSLIGGIYAMGELPRLANWVCTLNKKEVYNLMDFTISTNGLIKCNKALNQLNELIPDTKIEDMNIPFSAIATDIINKKEIIFNEGSFYNAARASIAIPSIITPVAFNGKILVDGGIVNPIPVNRVKRQPNDILVAVNLYDSNDKDQLQNQIIKTNQNSLKSIIKNDGNNKNNKANLMKKVLEFIPNGDKHSHGYYTLLQLSSSIMLEKITELSLEIVKPDILINIPLSSAKIFDFHKSTEIIEIGRNAAAFSINEYEKKQYNDKT